MANQLLNLPLNVPWMLVGVSQDMMDVDFCDKQFPFEWRSSLALSVFEPKAEDLPEDLCEGIVTFLKVTCTITGYQPTREETERGYVEFPDIPTERLDSILREYFACYGALLNVAVFPLPLTRRELRSVIHSFKSEHPRADLPNPLELEGLSYEAAGEAANRIADINLTAGGRVRALDLRNEMTVTLSTSTPKLEAKVARLAQAITMKAFDGAQPVGSATTAARNQVETLVVEADAVDRVVFTTTQDEAFLVELTTYDAEDVPIDVKDFPHIIDFEPKTRDLYQAATETGVSLSGTVGYAAGQGGGPFGSITGGLTHKWGDTEQDQFNVQTDASRESRENNATTTNLNQLYNLLTGYHPGTNRAVFLQLPRPHVLQPTDHRTFEQGLREIEGVQDFFLIVARPKGIAGLSVEAFLETGHFPEGMEVNEPEVGYEERFEDFAVTAETQIEDPGSGRGIKDGVAQSIERFPTSKYTIESGWVIDRRPSRQGQAHIDGWDEFHPGIRDLDADQDPAPFHVSRYNYQPISDSTVQITGLLAPNDDVVEFNRHFRVFTRSERVGPKNSRAACGCGTAVGRSESRRGCVGSADALSVTAAFDPVLSVLGGSPSARAAGSLWSRRAGEGD
jgi:hypothetical protein